MAGSSWCRPYLTALVLGDLLAVAIGATVAWAVGLVFVVAGSSGFDRLPVAQPVLLGAPAWLAALSLTGAYQRRSLGTGGDEYRRVLDAAVRYFAFVGTSAFFFNVAFPRGFVAITFVVTIVISLMVRFALRRWLHAARHRGRFAKSVLVVGSSTAVTELLGHLKSFPQSGFWPVAACVPEHAETIAGEGGTAIPVVAHPDRALHAALIERADAIVIADATTLPSGELRRLAWQLEGTGIELMVAPAVTDLAGPRISIRPVSELPLLHIEEPELKGLGRVGKVTFDRLFAIVALILLAPALAVIAIAVRLTSRGPVFFRQVRVGLGGRHFVLWKFRTMAHDAEERLSELMHLNEHDGLLFKMEHDPRVTRVGRLLRRWSIDEFPQLWNVLKGDMSIVGPRPPIPSEVEQYDDEIRRRLLVKPGMTGLWQVSGRAGLPWEEAVRLDLYYVENWSLSMDAMILGRTFIAVCRRNGAY